MIPLFSIDIMKTLQSIAKCSQAVFHTYTYQIQGKTPPLFNYVDRFLKLQRAYSAGRLRIDKALFMYKARLNFSSVPDRH